MISPFCSISSIWRQKTVHEQTKAQSEYCNPRAHARRALINRHAHHNSNFINQRWLPIQNWGRNEQDMDSTTRWSCTIVLHQWGCQTDVSITDGGCEATTLAPRGSPPLDNQVSLLSPYFSITQDHHWHWQLWMQELLHYQQVTCIIHIDLCHN